MIFLKKQKPCRSVYDKSLTRHIRVNYMLSDHSTNGQLSALAN